MEALHRALGFIGWRAGTASPKEPDFQQLMKRALDRVMTAELMLREADSLEQLDLARSAFMSAQAEVQQLIRSAKRERGIAVRPVAEAEAVYRNMQALINGWSPEQPPTRSRRSERGG